MTNSSKKTWFLYDGMSDQIVPFGPHLLLAEVDLGAHDTTEKQIQAAQRNGVSLMDYFNPTPGNGCRCSTCNYIDELTGGKLAAMKADCQVDSKGDCDCVVCHFNKTNDDPGLKVFRVGEDSPRAKHVYAAFITENGGYNPRLHGVFADEARAEQWLRQKPKVIGLDDPQEWYIERWAVNE